MSTSVAPRPAATVILLRDAGGPGAGTEVLLVRRVSSARFMPGVWVFAGGAVDPADRQAAARAAGPAVDRDELAHRICGAREVGEESGVAIGPGALVPWSRWVTPEGLPIRFDTRFYVAGPLAGARARPDMAEVDAALWLAPGAALAELARGALEISFPTVRHLEELRDLGSVDEVMAAASGRDIEALTPRVVGSPDSFEVLLPGDPGYAD